VCSVVTPTTCLVVDESLYAFEGKSPAKRYIPRKPHPNGLLVYGLACEALIETQSLPFCLDFEPIVDKVRFSAQDAMMALHSRLRERFPNRPFHFVVDSAFGSFERLEELQAQGITHL